MLTTTEEGVTEFTAAAAAAEPGRRADLERYVREGGGLFLLLQAVRYPHDEDEKFYNAMCEGFGVRMLHEGLFDPAHTFQSPPTLVFRPMEFFYTANVREHPTTAGVRRLYLPRYGSQPAPGVEALGLDPNWQVVVAGESTAKSYLLGDDNAHDARREGSQQASPPIAAVRSFGRGRLFVYSVHAKHVFINYANRMWPQITESDGDRQAEKPSDGNRLLLNALALAERAGAERGGTGGPPTGSHQAGEVRAGHGLGHLSLRPTAREGVRESSASTAVTATARPAWPNSSRRRGRRAWRSSSSTTRWNC